LKYENGGIAGECYCQNDYKDDVEPTRRIFTTLRSEQIVKNREDGRGNEHVSCELQHEHYFLVKWKFEFHFARLAGTKVIQSEPLERH
jgi:hypothetical protein